MTTRKQIERNILYGKIFSYSFFVGVPVVVIGYSIYSLYMGDYRHWGWMVIASLFFSWWLWYYWNVQTMSGETTDYEEMEAEYTNWLAGEHDKQLEAWDLWHKKQISFSELRNIENEFARDKAVKLAELEHFRTAKLSNNVVRFRHRS